MGDEQLLSEQRFFDTVRSTLREFVRKQGIGNLSDAMEIEIPSASLDASGCPRFIMKLPAALIVKDLGAAHIFYHDVSGRGFEFALRRFLDVHLLSDDVFIDVGAHWGIHSLTAATLRPRQISVLAIEPHPENSARLRSWVEQNQLAADVEVIPLAIGALEGVGRLRVSGSTMGHSLREGALNVGLTAIDVDVTTIDQLLVSRAHLRFRRVILKIDVEGCELDVLLGAQRLLSTGTVAAIIWEKASFHEPNVQQQRDTAVFDFLDARGFKHFHMKNGNLGGPLIALEDRDVMDNIFSLAPDFERKEVYA